MEIFEGTDRVQVRQVEAERLPIKWMEANALHCSDIEAYRQIIERSYMEPMRFFLHEKSSWEKRKVIFLGGNRRDYRLAAAVYTGIYIDQIGFNWSGKNDYGSCPLIEEKVIKPYATEKEKKAGQEVLSDLEKKVPAMNQEMENYEERCYGYAFLIEGIDSMVELLDSLRRHEDYGLPIIIWAEKLEEAEELYAVFPVQSGEMKNSVLNYIDLTENDELKEIAAAFSDKNPEMDYLRSLFHRKLALSTEQGFSSMKEGVIAGEIDRVVNQILSSMKLKDDSPEHQKAGTKLLAWIRKHIGDGLAQKYFPSFYNDDDQMRLLTPEAATAMANKAEAADWLMKELACENIEEAKDKFVRLMKLSTKNGEGAQLLDEWEEDESEAAKSANPLYFSSEDDVFFDQELKSSFDSEDAFNAFCKKVGLFGEKFAFGWLRKDLLSRGYTETAETASVESCGLRRFTKPAEEGTETAQLEYPDYQPGARNQPGYDIRLVLTTSAGKREEYYYEVKTHTTTSIVRNIIQMSDEQMRCALKHKEHYSILNVLYCRSDEENSQVEEFNDPEQQIAVGKMVNAWEGYRFKVR